MYINESNDKIKREKTGEMKQRKKIIQKIKRLIHAIK